MIFPQTSHFDDLQKQKGKRLPCGVFPLRSVSLAGSPFWALRGACEGGGGRAPAGQTVRRAFRRSRNALRAPGDRPTFPPPAFHQALRQAVHFGKIRCLDVVLFQLIVPPVRLGNGQLRLPQQCRGCLLQKAVRTRGDFMALPSR